MLKDFNQFLSEGVHAEFRKLTNSKIVDAVDLTLKHLGIDLHYCKFTDNGEFPNVLPGLTTGCDVSLIVDDNIHELTIGDRNKAVEVYMVYNVGKAKYYRIDSDGFVNTIDALPDVIKGHLFTIETYGFDSRDSAIIRDKKNLSKGDDIKIANKFNAFARAEIQDLSGVEKKITAVLNGLDKLTDSTADLKAKLEDVLNDDNIKSSMIKVLENYQKKLLKLSSTVEDCKQAFITSRNGL